MVQLTPSNESVRLRIEELEQRLRRALALVSALAERVSLLPASVPGIEELQSLAFILEQETPGSMGDCRWLLEAIWSRAPQIEQLVRSAA